MRACAGCRVKGERESFLKFVEHGGKPVLDIRRRLPGRGFNVCPDYRCIKAFVRKRYRGKLSPESLYRQVLDALKSYLLHLLSLSYRSGVAVVGQNNLKGLRGSGTLFLSREISPKTKERVLSLIPPGSLILDGLFSEEELGNAIGRGRSVRVLFIRGEGLGKRVKSISEKLSKLHASGGELA